MPSLDELYAQLLNKALEDNIISTEEKKMLDTLQIEGETYDDFLKTVSKHGISQDEINILSELKFNLLKKAYASAEEGDSISEDGEKLLYILVKLLNESI